MLPKTHIILGAIFSLIISLSFPQISFFNITLIFLSSFLIDVDHYLSYVFASKNFNLRRAFYYHLSMGKKEREQKLKGIRKRGPFHIFHTLEFLLLVFLLGYIWTSMWYILVGMLFHSILDIIYLVDNNLMYRREFFLIGRLLKVPSRHY